MNFLGSKEVKKAPTLHSDEMAFYAVEARPSSTCSFLTPPPHSMYLCLELPI
jgi:hypothetical protein